MEPPKFEEGKYLVPKAQRVKLDTPNRLRAGMGLST